MTKCNDGIKCIFNMELCDGREDCFDKSDENTTFCNGMYNKRKNKSENINNPTEIS